MQSEVSPSVNWRPAPYIVGVDGDLMVRRWDASLGDANLLLAVSGDPKVGAWTSVPFFKTSQDAELWISHRNEETDKGSGAYFVVEVGGVPVGSVNALKIDVYQAVVEIGYWFAPDHRGQGLGYRSCSILVDWLKSRGFRRIQLTVHPDNEASLGLAKKLGFEVEGLMRSYKFNRHGEREDRVLCALVCDGE